MTSDKIRPHHLARKAILYVRQSSAHQVLHNRESSALQYAMRDRLITLGWSQIETVDDDLGRSAAGSITRVGFERMVAEARGPATSWSDRFARMAEGIVSIKPVGEAGATSIPRKSPRKSRGCAPIATT